MKQVRWSPDSRKNNQTLWEHLHTGGEVQIFTVLPSLQQKERKERY